MGNIADCKCLQIETKFVSGIAQSVQLSSMMHISPALAQPMPGCRCVEEISLAAMRATKRLEGVTPEVSLREYVTYIHLPSANQVPILALKPRGEVTGSSKQGYQ